MNEQTEPLSNGSELPKHPSLTTSREIVEYGQVKDANDGTVLTSGLHQSEVSMLMKGQQMALGHLYRYAIRNNRIYHTRARVVIDCQTESIDEVV